MRCAAVARPLRVLVVRRARRVGRDRLAVLHPGASRRFRRSSRPAVADERTVAEPARRLSRPRPSTSRYRRVWRGSSRRPAGPRRRRAPRSRLRTQRSLTAAPPRPPRRQRPARPPRASRRRSPGSSTTSALRRRRARRVAEPAGRPAEPCPMSRSRAAPTSRPGVCAEVVARAGCPLAPGRRPSPSCTCRRTPCPGRAGRPIRPGRHRGPRTSSKPVEPLEPRSPRRRRRLPPAVGGPAAGRGAAAARHRPARRTSRRPTSTPRRNDPRPEVRTAPRRGSRPVRHARRSPDPDRRARRERWPASASCCRGPRSSSAASRSVATSRSGDWPARATRRSSHSSSASAIVALDRGPTAALGPARAAVDRPGVPAHRIAVAIPRRPLRGLDRRLRRRARRDRHDRRRAARSGRHASRRAGGNRLGHPGLRRSPCYTAPDAVGGPGAATARPTGLSDSEAPTNPHGRDLWRDRQGARRVLRQRPGPAGPPGDRDLPDHPLAGRRLLGLPRHAAADREPDPARTSRRASSSSSPRSSFRWRSSSTRSSGRTRRSARSTSETSRRRPSSPRSRRSTAARPVPAG